MVRLEGENGPVLVRPEHVVAIATVNGGERCVVTLGTTDVWFVILGKAAEVHALLFPEAKVDLSEFNAS